ncbi:UNVERIFIED_CONTAM: hypothetical protein HDU68_012253, partial [Siphonaria sp. JEL0065]
MNAFSNRLQLPTYADLPLHDTPDEIFLSTQRGTNDLTPIRHYCFLAQIQQVSFIDRPRITICTDATTGSTAIIESNSRSSPTTFSWPDLKPGNTIAILYATKRILSDGTLGIRQDDLSKVYIFRAQVSAVVSYATKLTCKPRECFQHGCVRKTMLI